MRLQLQLTPVLGRLPPIGVDMDPGRVAFDQLVTPLGPDKAVIHDPVLVHTAGDIESLQTELKIN